MAYEAVILITVAFVAAEGSSLQFTASSDTILPQLTPNMTMRCSIPDSNSTLTSPSGSLIGRRAATAPAMTSQDVRLSDIRSVTSLVISRDGVDVAMVSEHIPAHALAGKTFSVTGAITPGVGGERGFIEINWQYPVTEDTGNYVCEVNALTESGHNVVFTESLAVNLGEATLADLINHIHTLEVSDALKSNEIQILKAQNKLHDNELQVLKTDNQKKDAEIQALNTKIESLKSDLVEARHVEHGQINCGRQFTDWQYNRTKNVSLQFQKAYTKAPVVHLSVSQLDTSIEQKYLDYFINLGPVDASGFVVTCNNPNDFPYHTSIINIRVDWISIPQ